MKWIIGLCFAFSLNINGIAQQQAPRAESVNTLENEVYDLSLLGSEIKYNFVNIDRLDFDGDSLYQETMLPFIC